MKTMMAEEFYKRFADKVKETAKYEDKPIFEIYNTDMKEYVKAINKYFVPRILNELNFSAENEYFKIDTIGWIPPMGDEELRKEARALKLNANLSDLMVAVEHETDKSAWVYKLAKLAHIKCPLKVIVGYAPCGKRDEDLHKAQFAYKCLTKLNVFDPETEEEFLLILGNSASDESNRFDFRGYILDREIQVLKA